MIELKTLAFDDNKLVLSGHQVTTAILPRKATEMSRDIEVRGPTEVEGAVYARNLSVHKGPLSVKGALYTGQDLLVAHTVGESVRFHKAVASSGAVVAQTSGERCLFGADLNAQKVKLSNAFVAANVFGAEIVLENCVVLGGVFATKSLSLRNCVVGTFNTPRALLSGRICFLMPSAFSIEPFTCAEDTILENLTLADLGSLIKGGTQQEKSGKIRLDPKVDVQRTQLSDESGNQIQVHTYTVASKVLAADLLDLHKLQNHFLLHAGMLGPQLLRNYDLGTGADGATVDLTQLRIAEFLFSILEQRILVQTLDGRFTISEVAKAYSED